MLKRFLLILVVATLLQGGTAMGSKPKKLPAIYNGSMMPYDFSKCDEQTAWPDSLMPVYVGYVARHGARYLSSPRKIERIKKALEKGESKNKLTAKGKSLLKAIREVVAATDGKWGLLSATGIEEEVRLGSEMALMLPELFHTGRMNSISTEIPRVIMTMDQFLHALEIPHQQLELHTSSGLQNARLLSCFAADSAYAEYRSKGEWNAAYDEYVKRHVSDAPARRLFVAGYLDNRKELRKLVMSMYGLFQANDATGNLIDTYQFMNDEEYEQCWLAMNVHHYLQNSITPWSNLAAKATLPLLEQIVADADTALEDGEVVADGYFGHAETLLPLFSLMGLPGCYTMTENLEDLIDNWQVQEITPLGANLAVILLRGESGKMYVSLRLNGRNIAPYADGAEIVEWQQLKNYWSERVATLCR